MTHPPESKVVPAIPAGDRAAMVGQIILTGRRVETLLHQVTGSDAAGIHALTEILGGQLSEGLRRKLHYLASVRNQVAHEEEFAPTAEEFATFQRCAAEAEEELNTHFADRIEAAAQESAAGTSAGEGDAGFSGDELAVERELWARWTRTIHQLGFVPGFGVINLLRLLLSSLYDQIGVGLLIIFYFCAIPMIIEGIRGSSETGGLLKIGVATAAAVYVATLVLGWRRRIPGLPGIFYWFPGLHIGYLAVWWSRNMAWGKFLLTLAGIGALVLSIVLAVHGRWEWAGWALLAQWVIGVAAALIWPPED